MKQIKGMQGCNIHIRSPALKMTEGAQGEEKKETGRRQEGRGSNQWFEDCLLVKPEQHNMKAI